MITVTFVMGTKYSQEGLPGYGHGAGSPFEYSMEIDGDIQTYEGARILFGMVLGSIKEKISQTIENDGGYVPPCYLTLPTIEVDGMELLVDDVHPNPWLSKSEGAAKV